MNLIQKIKEYYPLIVLMAILFILLIDCENYQVLIIFSNVFGFSFMTNNLIKERYSEKIICKNSLLALNFINAINIVGCFFDYEFYIRILLISVSFLTILITIIQEWIYMKK